MKSFNWTNALQGLFGHKVAGRCHRKVTATQIEGLEERLVLRGVNVGPDISGVIVNIAPSGDGRIDDGATENVLNGTLRTSRGKLNFSGLQLQTSGAGADDSTSATLSVNGRPIQTVQVNGAGNINFEGFSVGPLRKKTGALDFSVSFTAAANAAGGNMGVTVTEIGLRRFKGGVQPGVFVPQHAPINVGMGNVNGGGGNPDPAGFTVYPGDQNVEEGTSSSVGVKLNSQPSSNVTLNFNLTSGPIGLSNSSVTFTPGNWNTIQYVTLNAPENTIDQPDQSQSLTISVNDALSADNYDPLADQVFTYGFMDNDSTVNPIVGDHTLSVSPPVINENGGTTTATVTLNTSPTGPVHVQVSASNGALSGGTTLVFAAGETSKTVTFTSVNNSTDEADRSVVITATITSASDTRFTSATPKTATVIIADDDPTVNPDPTGPSYDFGIYHFNGMQGIYEVQSMTATVNGGTLKPQHTFVLGDRNGNQNVGDPGEEFGSTMVLNGNQVTINMSEIIEVGPGGLWVQVRGIQSDAGNITFTPLSMVIKTPAGQTLNVQFVPQGGSGGRYYEIFVTT